MKQLNFSRNKKIALAAAGFSLFVILSVMLFGEKKQEVPPPVVSINSPVPETEAKPQTNPENKPVEEVADKENTALEKPENLPGEVPENIFAEPALPQELDFNNLPFKGSLMFDRKTMENLYAAIAGTVTQMDNSGMPPGEVQELVAPAFFLSSMIYIDKDSWSVWVNEKKYSEAAFQSLYIDNINRDKVAFIWQANNLDAIAPNWQNKFEFVTAENNKFTGLEGYLSADRNIFVDKTGQVFFKLAVNQSFVSRTMEIVEGKATDTIINQASSPAAGN